MNHFYEQQKRASAAELISAQALRTARLMDWLTPIPIGSSPDGIAAVSNLSARLTRSMPTHSLSGSSQATSEPAPNITVVKLIIYFGNDTSGGVPMSAADPTLN